MEEDNGYRVQRLKMVNEQLQARGIKDELVLQAMEAVSRHLFVPENLKEKAYEDRALNIGFGQTISQPYMVALMTESLILRRTDRVLEIGTGSGYQTAILANIAEKVYTIECIKELFVLSQKTLTDLGYKNIFFKEGDGSMGWEEKWLFDKIIVTASAPEIPKLLVAQLAENGRLVIPVGEKRQQELVLVERSGDSVKTSRFCSCVFVPLIGEYGWKQERM